MHEETPQHHRHRRHSGHGVCRTVDSTKAKSVTGVLGYHWAYEKTGYAVKSSERYYAKVNATDKCKAARSPVLNADSY